MGVRDEGGSESRPQLGRSDSVRGGRSQWFVDEPDAGVAVASLERDNPLRPIPRAPLGLAINLQTLPNPPTPARVRLGRWLFFDRRLSADRTISCASCHEPKYGLSQPTSVAMGSLLFCYDVDVTSFRRVLRWLSPVGVVFWSVAGANAAPCVSATPQCTEFVVVRDGPARVLTYRSHALTTSDQAITHAVIVIHGAERDAATSFRIAAASAVLRGRIETTLILAPRFAARLGSACTDDLSADELNWQCDVQLGDWRSGGAAITDGSLTSFDVLDDLLRRIEGSGLFPNLRTVVVAGHSAGGQFVTNYQMTNRLHEQLRVPPAYVTANASAYAYPDDQRPVAVSAQECPAYANWPFGTAARVGYAAGSSLDRRPCDGFQSR
jgi:hypothetical protein